MSADPVPRRLLVLACSAAKRRDPTPLEARQRYDGPLWRTLRTVDPSGRLARVAFLSARYGFRDAGTKIDDYDARLTDELAKRMIAGGIETRWPRPPWPSNAEIGAYPGAEISALSNSCMDGAGLRRRSRRRPSLPRGHARARQRLRRGWRRRSPCPRHRNQRADRLHAARPSSMASRRGRKVAMTIAGQPFGDDPIVVAYGAAGPGANSRVTEIRRGSPDLFPFRKA